MNRAFVTALIMGTLMLASSGLTKVATPTTRMASSRPAGTLDQMVPKQFGDWREDNIITAAIINPERQAVIDRLYSETLTRTYVNQSGERIMLSIAYGADQRDGYQMHYPEVCYPAQGFAVEASRQDAINTSFGQIPVQRLETNLTRQRYEPVTYWATVGDKIAPEGIKKKIVEMQYGLQGVIPDGLLFRVSSIEKNSERAFRTHDAFVLALVANLESPGRKRLTGMN